jgi:hypothetical protein
VTTSSVAANLGLYKAGVMTKTVDKAKFSATLQVRYGARLLAAPCNNLKRPLEDSLDVSFSVGPTRSSFERQKPCKRVSI